MQILAQTSFFCRYINENILYLSALSSALLSRGLAICKDGSQSCVDPEAAGILEPRTYCHSPAPPAAAARPPYPPFHPCISYRRHLCTPSLLLISPLPTSLFVGACHQAGGGDEPFSTPTSVVAPSSSATTTVWVSQLRFPSP